MKSLGYYTSPLGVLEIIEEDGYIVKIDITDIKKEESKSEVLEKCKIELDEYFSGNREVFSVPVNFQGTEFQKKVWRELIKIPYGETRSYKEIAECVKCVNGSRAVGNANNKNPIIIIVPCHRVLGSSGKMVGYRSGIKNKEFLLELENR